jgi:hypothetical protein
MSQRDIERRWLMLRVENTGRSVMAGLEPERGLRALAGGT